MNADGQSLLGFGLNIDHRELQRLGGGLGGLLVFGAEPRSLRELGAGRSAVNKDGGDWGWFWLSWARYWLISIESKRTPKGSDGEREQARDAITMVCVCP